mmetsp:Transcript_6787/g.7590  ORF Transcript_6787/g.7590 Transcript_6787/m.7590 type:complete len:222 (-) Transcript_6787:28-693(-)
MMIYVERLLQSLTEALRSTGSKYPYQLTSFNGHRIILTSLLLAHKYSMDVAYPFSLLSKLVGVTPPEMKVLESEFLVFIKFSLYVSQDFYAKYEEVFCNWPDLPGEENVQQKEMNLDEKKGREETKEIDECLVVKKEPTKVSDEDAAMSYIDEDKPNPSSRHEKCIILSPSSTIQNLDVRSLFYEDDPESNSEDEDTEMTIYDENDLGFEELDDDIIIGMY